MLHYKQIQNSVGQCINSWKLMPGNRHPKVALRYHPTGRRDPGISHKSLRPDRKMKKNAASNHKISHSFLVKLSTLLLGHAV